MHQVCIEEGGQAHWFAFRRRSFRINLVGEHRRKEFLLHVLHSRNGCPVGLFFAALVFLLSVQLLTNDGAFGHRANLLDECRLHLTKLFRQADSSCIVVIAMVFIVISLSHVIVSAVVIVQGQLDPHPMTCGSCRNHLELFRLGYGLTSTPSRVLFCIRKRKMNSHSQNKNATNKIICRNGLFWQRSGAKTATHRQLKSVVGNNYDWGTGPKIVTRRAEVE